MLLSVFPRGTAVFLLESSGKIGVIVKAGALVDLANGKPGKGKEVLGVGKSNVIQIGLEIHAQLLGKAIREVSLGKPQMIGGVLQRNAGTKIFQHVQNRLLNVGRMVFNRACREARHQLAQNASQKQHGVTAIGLVNCNQLREQRQQQLVIAIT